MKGALSWCLRVGLALLPVAVAAGAVPQLIDGIALNAAFPVPVYIQLDAPLPRAAYLHGADALARGVQRDGERAIFEAEALADAGASRGTILSVLRDGLSRSPATPRGWALMSELLMPVDRKQAANALGISLTLAPADYYLVDRQVLDAGELWDVLPDDAKQVAINAAPVLWTKEELHSQIRPVLRTRGGPELMSKAFRFDPEQLRQMNRWLTLQRQQEEGQK